MSAPYDFEGLWLKAKLFVNHAMDDPAERSFEERALWASLALELLAKAALARQSPLLIAVPSEDGTNVLIALGLIGGDARFESVPAKTLYSRCEKAFKPFDKGEAGKITQARNAYLHGPTAEFAKIPEKAWWPRYWAQAVILVSACDRAVVDLVGYSRAPVVSGHLEQNRKNIEHRTEMLVERARQRRAQYEAGTLPAKVAREWQPGQSMSAGLSHSHLVECPACENEGFLEGDEVVNVDTQYYQISEEDYDVVVTLTVQGDYFGCPHCGLVLDSYELLSQVGLAEDFDIEGGSDDIPAYEGDYGND